MKFKSSEYGELKNHPTFKGLPEELKDPKCYKSIEQRIKLTMVSDHKHAKVASFVNCKRCKAKMEKKQKVLKEYGFKSYHQYLMWRKIMEIIKQGKDFKVI